MSDTSIVRVKDQLNKKVYNVFILGKDTKTVAKEVYRDGVVKFFPFYYDVRDKKVKSKYKNISHIGTYNRKLPSSGLFSESRGYGFTSAQGVNTFFKYLDKTEKIKSIMFTDEETVLLEDGTLDLNFKDYAKLHFKAKSFFVSKREEQEHLIQQFFHNLLPNQVAEPEKLVHSPGSTERFISKYSLDHYFLNEDEVKLLNRIIVSSGLSVDTIISTKNQIDKIYIEEVLKEYEELMQIKNHSKNLEEKWHQFFKKHTWIFSSIFAFPAVYFGDKVNVGGKDFFGNTDKIVDFLFKNDLTDNIAFIEIKTHKTKLVNERPYRRPDIYSISADVSGAMVQVLDQRSNLTKNYHAKIGLHTLDSLNSTCLVLIGSIEALKSKSKRDSFELFRSGNRDVIVITFDELLKKISTLLSIFTKNS